MHAIQDIGRRRWVKAVSATALAPVPVLLGACGTRTPAPPPPPPKPVRRLLVLPPDWASVSESNTGFGVAPAPVYVYGGVSRSSGGRSSSGAGAAVAGALIAGLIVWGIAENRKREAQSIADALAAVAFDPLRHADERLAPALEARGVALARVSDPAVVRGVRHTGVKSVADAVPADVDAWLDLRVDQSGYYSSSRAGGLSPMLQFSVTIRDVEGRELDSFSYYADWRDGGGDRRWVTTPRTLTYANTNLLKDDAATVRSGLAELVERFVAMIAEDVQRHAAGLARVD